MNPHYHTYSELSSPHSPPPDNSSYHHPPPPQPGGPQQPVGLLSNGHPGGGPPHPGMHHPDQHLMHHHHHHQHPLHHGGPGPYPPPQHILNNNNNNNNMVNNNANNNNNNNNGGMGGMGSPNPQHMHPTGGGGPPPPTIKVCGGCGGKIMERFLLHALDRYWHNGCLKCSCCSAMLADIGSSCFTKAGMILCKNDYVRLFGHSGACSGCGQTIPASEFVMRAGSQGHVYHVKCFACSKCQGQLMPGDRFCLLAGSLVCEQDWHKLIKGAAVTGPGPLTPGTPGGPGTPSGPGSQTGPGTGVRKGKVGRPRRSRD